MKRLPAAFLGEFSQFSRKTFGRERKNAFICEAIIPGRAPCRRVRDALPGPKASLIYHISIMEENKSFSTSTEEPQVETNQSVATELPAATETPAPEAAEAAPAEDPVAEEQPATAAAPAEDADTAPEAAPAEAPLPSTKEEVVEALKAFAQSGEVPSRADLEQLKQLYYRYRNAEVVAARDAFVAAGGTAEEFRPAPDALEEAFKAEMDYVKELRAKDAAKAEEEKQQNLKRKQEIIEQVKTLGESPESADKNYDTVKKLQAEWREIKSVPAERATELWKNYQLYVERFYDQLHLNHEARMYDFRKNLEKKTALCEAAERLAAVEDPVSAFHQLQVLHQQFRETGPVEKEKREEIWKRFKDASTEVNKRHQAHFEGLKAMEEENLVKKTALCEKVEALDVTAVKSFGEWDKLTKQVLEWQAEWKTVGFTPKKMNTKIFERFRAACDTFFHAKADYFRQMRESYSANLEEKNKLAEEAEALKESTDWNSTANKLIALQKKWKATGPVAHKVGEAVWKRFNEACNYFFERKNEATGQQRQEEEANLAAKNEVVDALEKLLAEPTDNVREAVRELQDKWNATGHVPFRKKDKLFARYRAVCDRIFDELHISARRRSVENFRRNVAEKAGSELSRERQRLKTLFDEKSAEIKNYETNLSFFSSKSKDGNSIVEDIQKKIDRLKDDLAVIAEKLQVAREKERAEAAADEQQG